MRPAFEKLFARSEKLEVVTGEMWNCSRRVEDDVPAGQVAVMEGVEHLGQYVYEMTQAKIRDLESNGNAEHDASQPSGVDGQGQ